MNKITRPPAHNGGVLVGSGLAKLERTIGSIADRIRGGADLSHVGVKSEIAKVGIGIKRQFNNVIGSSKTYGLAIAASGRKFLSMSAETVSLPSSQQTVTLKRPKTGLSALLISVCFGLIAVCGIMIFVVSSEIRNMKAEIAQWQNELAATKTQLNQIEKVGRQQNNTVKVQSAHVPLAFNEAEIKVIRQFIKVLPPKPGAQQKIYVGDEISSTTLATVPDSLVDQIPKLRGAKFSIDQDGAIIIVGEGRNRADAVISYR